ncbi:Fe-S metabolism protein SufE [Psychromonas sp. MB-3u-54]|uniref:SufE family protein n=1 Tax=Psychromonas sp. MB-3u-54 TaxID=2058319 RepID=UPI000C31C44D|nr:SufE family protein [Psychromonas sp. MB-3u-54]PKH01258.1 Fe-S metabolism protein SufE [Psychromonas sp. MB-3u-54]
MALSLPTTEQLLNDFQENKSWDKQYKLIIQWGKKLPEMDSQDKIETNRVQGCESLAWLIIEKEEDFYTFKMDSETRVVKGLMMILLIIYQGKNAEQIRHFDIHHYFEKLGLLKHLSPSRSNGLFTIVQQIQEI